MFRGHYYFKEFKDFTDKYCLLTQRGVFIQTEQLWYRPSASPHHWASSYVWQFEKDEEGMGYSTYKLSRKWKGSIS